jgi:hypothetical protein
VTRCQQPGIDDNQRKQAARESRYKEEANIKGETDKGRQNGRRDNKGKLAAWVAGCKGKSVKKTSRGRRRQI